MPDPARHPPPLSESDLRDLLRQRLERHGAELREIIWAIGRKRGLHDAAALDDLLGEVVKQVLEQARKYDPSRSVVPWAVGFVANIFLQRGERQARGRCETNATDLGSEGERIVFEALDRASRSPGEHNEVHAWLQQLHESDQEVIRRRFFDGLSGPALAVALGVSPPASRARLCRAVQRLRKIAQAEGGDR